MRAAFRAVPADLEEAAFVDGATRFTAFRRITLPLATPSILVAALVAFLLAYTEFALAWLFISTNENVTLAMVLAQATTGFFTSNWSATAAYALLMAIPVVLVFIVLQRALLQGLARRLGDRLSDGPRAASRGTLPRMCRSIRQLRRPEDAGPATTGEAARRRPPVRPQDQRLPRAVRAERRGVPGRRRGDRARDPAPPRGDRDRASPRVRTRSRTR